MSKQISSSTPELNRLRAAAALIPIIESGLADSKLTHERASLMAAFCEWTTEKPGSDPEAEKLAGKIKAGLIRLQARLEISVQK